jgi:predicted RecB family endonuclease
MLSPKTWNGKLAEEISDILYVDMSIHEPEDMYILVSRFEDLYIAIQNKYEKLAMFVVKVVLINQ